MTDFTYPLAAIRADGTTIIATTPDEAVAFRRLNPGPMHAEGQYDWQGRLIHFRHEWIVRDHHGRVVLHAELPDDRIRTPWYARRLALAQAAAERGLPIPGTGSRRRYSSGYRAYRTNMAMRAAEAALADDLADWGVPDVRVGRRRAHDLPQVWDDVAYRTGRRSWKLNRLTRWRDRG